MPDRVLFSPWMRRLGRISFLGALDQAEGCLQRPSRLDHSAGVATLALSVGRSLKLDEASLRLLVTSALLHDVGHFPLSHTAEPAFRARLGVDHHGVSRWIVLGGGPVPRARSLAPALGEAGVDPDAAWALVSGDAASPLAPLLTGAINVDTLDGIPRAARAFGMRAPRIPPRAFALRDGRLVILRDAVPAMDRFWSLKNRTYRDVINSPAHAALELRVSSLVGRHVTEGALDDLEAFDDAALLRMLGVRARDLAPDESELASSFVASGIAGTAPVRVLREHAVDARVTVPAGGLPAEAWARRWRTSKHRFFLVTRSAAVQLVLPGCWEVEGDLP